MRLYNTLTRQVEEFKPLSGNKVRMYSCGPTVYDRAHIGNLASYIYADTLRRILEQAGFEVQHIMNYTDVDDKTIARSQEKYPDLEPKEALKKLTDKYIELFLSDCKKAGIDIEKIEFVRATDHISDIQKLIEQLVDKGFAYVTDDGVYFSIEAYKKAGKTYGQLLNISSENTSSARIDNDEYDKESVHDFALWKKGKSSEPAWEFEINGQNLAGRPGWHIECSAMSQAKLGIPFDIHTGGIDLIFPHHENEIAQSTAVGEGIVMSHFFTHNEHVLVGNKKMAKSVGNCITLADIEEKGFNPLALRLLVLQSHYHNPVHFTWELLEEAQKRLMRWKNTAEIRWQENLAKDSSILDDEFEKAYMKKNEQDVDLPESIPIVEKYLKKMDELHICKPCIENIFVLIDSVLGLDITRTTGDIETEQKDLVKKRQQAKERGDFAVADALRQQLKQQGIGLEDQPNGTRWYRI